MNGHFWGVVAAIASSAVIGGLIFISAERQRRERNERQYEVTCGSERFVVADVGMSWGGTRLYERVDNQRRLVRSFSAGIPCVAIRIN